MNRRPPADTNKLAMSVQSAQSNSDGETRYNSKTFASNAYFPDIPRILPHEKVGRAPSAAPSDRPADKAAQVYPIQIGCELFRLRWVLCLPSSET